MVLQWPFPDLQSTLFPENFDWKRPVFLGNFSYKYTSVLDFKDFLYTDYGAYKYDQIWHKTMPMLDVYIHKYINNLIMSFSVKAHKLVPIYPYFSQSIVKLEAQGPGAPLIAFNWATV